MSESMTPVETNDYHHVPATPRQLTYARRIARDARIAVPDDALSDRRALSTWIEKHRDLAASSPFDAYPTAKQVAFAERIARRRRNDIPPECFRDKTRMSRWIDANL